MRVFLGYHENIKSIVLHAPTATGKFKQNNNQKKPIKLLGSGSAHL